MSGSHISLDRQQRRPWQLPVEVLAGAATGLVLSFGGGYLGPMLVRGFENGWNDLAASLVGALLGYLLGAPLGVIAAAHVMRRHGLAWRAVLGSAVGGVAIVLLAEPLRLNQQPWLLMSSFAAAALLGAVLGFHKRSTNKHESNT